MTCELCGGSGVLQILGSILLDHLSSGWDSTPYPAPCHGCPAGDAWAQAGL